MQIFFGENSSFLLGVGNLGSDNSLKWPQISTKWQKDNRQYTLEARYVIIIKNFPVFVPPKSDRKYSHTNSYIFAVTAITQDDHRSQLELGRPVDPPKKKKKKQSTDMHALWFS